MLRNSGVTPYVHVTAPQKQSGKTTLMDVLGTLAARPMPTTYISAAGLRRILDEQPPYTLLFDEVDQVFAKRGEDTSDLRAVLNAGFKRGAIAMITVRGGKKDWEVKPFQVFGPKVLVSIGKLPDTIESRSIPILLERMARTEKRTRFRQAIAEARVAPLRLQLEALQDVELCNDPDIPEELSGRQADIWEPLLQIADWLSPVIGCEARAAAIKLHSGVEDEDPGAALLRHIKELFDEREASAMYSQDLVDMLLENEEWPYQRIVDGGRPLDMSKLAQMLNPFGIRPIRMRLYHIDSKQQRGYYRVSFEDAWSRYL